MPRKVPVGRELRWLYLLPQFAATVAVISVCIATVGYPAGLLWGVSIYLAYSFGSRAIMTRDHRAGMRKISERQWAQALPCFQTPVSAPRSTRRLRLRGRPALPQQR